MYKRFVVLLTFCASLLCVKVVGQSIPGNVRASADVAMGTDGSFHYFSLDSGGNLSTNSGGGSSQGGPGGYVGPVAPVAIGIDGQFHYLKVDSNGNLLVSNSAGVGVTQINGSPGAFTFNGAGVSCTLTTCTFSGTGSGIGSIAWTIPSWLTASPTTISASGTQTFSPTTGQTSHQVIGTCGAGTTFAPCSLVAADLPTIPNTQISGLGAVATAAYPAAGMVLSSGSAFVSSLAYSATTGLLFDTAGTLAWSAHLPASGEPAHTGDMTNTAGSLATTVVGLDGVLFCTGYTPTNGQSIQYTTASSPNPCYTAVTGSGMVYPGAGVGNSTGSAWGTSYTVGVSANNLVQLNGSAQLPAVSGVNLTSMTASQVGLGSVTNDAQTKAAVVPNTAPAAGKILVGNAGGTAYAPVSMSQDVTINSSGVATVGGLDGVLFCTGYTPTAGNVPTYTTTSSPNPCYGAATPTGTGNTTSTSLSTNKLPKASGSNSIIDSSLSDNGLSLSSAEGLSVGSLTIPGDGVHAGMASIYPNTTVPTLVSGDFNLLGPNAASVTQYGWQVPSAFNSSAGLLHVGAGVSAGGGEVSQLTISLVALASDVTGQLPISGVGSAGLSGTSPITINSAGAIGCATCVTSAAVLANNGLLVGSGGGQGVATGNGDFTYATHTLSGGSSGLIVLSAANALTLSAMTGTTCLEQVSGVVTSTGLACGSGGGSTVPVNLTTTTVNANSTSAQQLQEVSIPSGFFNTANATFGLDTAGYFTTPTGQTPTVTITHKLCTVSGCGSGTAITLDSYTSGVASVSSTDAPWRSTTTLGTSIAGTSGQLEVHGNLSIGLGTTAAVAASTYGDGNTALASAINLSGALFLDTFVTFSTNGATSNTAVQKTTRLTAGTPPASISATVSPSTASVNTLATQAFTATMSNDFSGQGVTWALSGAGCSGATCGTLSSVTTTSVTYTGPSSVPSPATVTLTATSIADTTKTSTATITVTSSGGSGATIVQPTSGNPLLPGCANNSTTNTCALPLSVTSGNTLFVMIAAGATGTVGVPVKSAGTATIGTCTAVGSGSTAGGEQQWYTCAITGSGSLTISETFSTSTNVGVFPFEVNNSAGADTVTCTVGAGSGGACYHSSNPFSTAYVTTALTPTTAGDLILLARMGGTSQTFSALTPYTLSGQGPGTTGNNTSWFTGNFTNSGTSNVAGAYTTTPGSDTEQDGGLAVK